jgi:hypothetical protein
MLCLERPFCRRVLTTEFGRLCASAMLPGPLARSEYTNRRRVAADWGGAACTPFHSIRRFPEYAALATRRPIAVEDVRAHLGPNEALV